MKRNFAILALPVLFLTGAAPAAVTIDAGLTEVFFGFANSVEIPVKVLGGDSLTDMVGAVEIAGATITAVSYAGSVWETAPGGAIDFFPGFPAPGNPVDPNISLLVPGESVAANGVLFTLTVDISGLGVGDHPVKLSGTAEAGTTEVYLNGVARVTTIANGTLRITKKPIDLWREANFPAAFGNPALEATVWGDSADPDHDLLKNHLEFALGLDPNDPALHVAEPLRSGLPQEVIVHEGGEDYLGLRFSRRIERPCHLVEIESGSDLKNWDGTPAATVEVSAPVPLPGGEYELVLRRHAQPLSPGISRRFLRLKVTQLDP